jgi:hypothetical protein
LVQLAQTYIHLKPYRVSRKRLNSLGRRAQKIAVKTALEVYGGGVTVDVRLEEGSLRTWVSVAGVLAVYGAIADYKGFKESIQEMCKDAREYSVDVCGAFTEAAKVNKGQVYRVERRLKTPGKINRVLKKIEQLDKAAETMGTDKLQDQLKDVQDELQAIQSELSEEDRKKMRQALIFENLPMLRERPRNRRAEPAKAAKKPDEEEEPFLMDIEPSTDPDKTHQEEQRMVYHEKIYVPPQAKRRRRVRDVVSSMEAID